MSLKKIGDWAKVTTLVKNLQNDLKHAQDLSLKRFGLKAEAISVGHISKQDLPWPALKPSTTAQKVRQGFSENILVRSSLYFESITSYVISDVSYIGVRRNVKTKDGQVLANIAAIHEFGSKSANIPARKLWEPTLRETVEWNEQNNNPVEIFLDRLKKRI